MLYLYVTTSNFLCTSKRKDFSNCINDKFISLVDDSIDNPMTVQVIYNFYKKLVEEGLYPLIMKNKPEFVITEYEKKIFLKKFGLTESFINQEYSSIHEKYDKYYTRISRAYYLMESAIEHTKFEEREREDNSMGLSARQFIEINMEDCFDSRYRGYRAIQGVCRNGLLVSFLLNGHTTPKEGTEIGDCNFKNIEVAFENFEYMSADVKKCMADYCDKFQKPVVYCAYMPMGHVEDIIGTAGGIVCRTQGLHELGGDMTNFEEYIKSI